MKRLAVLFAAAFTFLSASAFADERITNYASEISVAQTGALTVTETISVISEGDEIRHGIFRDFPTIYEAEDGRRIQVVVDGLSATRDGHAEA